MISTLVVLLLISFRGEAVWDGLCKAGQDQSPINIQSYAAEVNYEFGMFSRSLFDILPTSMRLENTGNSIQVSLEGGYTISDPSLLPGNFKAAQFHIHWAEPRGRGSEHILNGKHYFGELHIVHYNTKYENFSLAADKSDGLAVLGFFLEDTYPQDNFVFGEILAPFLAASNEFFGGSTQTIPKLFTIESILPPNIDTYYRYKGSLTIPGCYESVEWTVFETPIRISRAQAEILETQVYMEADYLLNGNFRPLQELNGRTVQKSPPICMSGSSPIAQLSTIILLSTIACNWINEINF